MPPSPQFRSLASVLVASATVVVMMSLAVFGRWAPDADGTELSRAPSRPPPAVSALWWVCVVLSSWAFAYQLWVHASDEATGFLFATSLAACAAWTGAIASKRWNVAAVAAFTATAGALFAAAVATRAFIACDLLAGWSLVVTALAATDLSPPAGAPWSLTVLSAAASVTAVALQRPPLVLLPIFSVVATNGSVCHESGTISGVASVVILFTGALLLVPHLT